MYTGPGSAPLVAAAAAWDGLAADLYATASSYQSVISNLTSGWSGPSAMAMAGAATPYVSWMSATAAAAAQASEQATGAVSAYETAFAMTVPPAVVATNRALLAELVATNIFGQNTPAIAATEAQYLEMWAQDVAAMNGYAVASTTTVQMTPMSAPPATTNAAATATPLLSASDAASFLATLTNLSTEVQGALSSLTASAPVSSIQALLNSSGLTSYFSSFFTGPNSLQTISYLENMGATPAQMFLNMGNSSAASTGLTDGESLISSIGQLVDGKLQLVVGGVTNQLKSWGGAISAQLAHAANISGLSIPPGWSTAAQGVGMTRAAPVLPPTSLASPALTQASAMPSSPFAQALMGALSGRGVGSIASKMPGAVKVMPHSPAGG
jgi:PPE-repeat protein